MAPNENSIDTMKIRLITHRLEEYEAVFMALLLNDGTKFALPMVVLDPTVLTVFVSVVVVLILV